MSEAKYTPGPWSVKSTENGDFQIIYNERGNWLAEVFEDDDPVEGRPLANAMLIAAAPDLLEWAKSALADYDEHGKITLAGIGHLRAAVDKAEGRKPATE